MNSSYQDDSILEDVREELSQEAPENPYEDFYLLSNPFPNIGEFYGICVDQEKVKDEFKRVLREFNLDVQRQIMMMIGTTGAGKTNLLRFLEQTIRSWQEPNSKNKAITDLFTIYVEQTQGNYLEIHRQIISQFAAMFFTKFFSEVRQHKINLFKLSTELPGTNPELIRALSQIAYRDSGQQLSLDDMLDQMSLLPEPQSYRILDNWLQGAKILSSQKKMLGNVSTEVGKSSTVAIKFLSDLVKIFLRIGIFKGVIIFIDELEEIFSGLTPTNQAQYAQDLRNLFDSLPKGIVFVVATAPITERLQNISPALQRRLGPGVHIAPISDEDIALKYAGAYIKLGRQKFEYKMDTKTFLPKDCPEADQPYYPLTEGEIKKVYNELKSRYGAENVIPGSLLPELNLLLYQRVYEEN